jgi:hypothetical protein
VLWPSPDLLFLVTVGGSVPTFGTVSLPLPSSVRPVTFWTQAVMVTPTGFPVSDAWRVDAL